MDPVEKAVDLINRYALLAYLSNGKCLGSDIKFKRVYLSGPITNVKNYKGLFMFAEELVGWEAEQVYNPASQIPSSSSWKQAMHRCLSEITNYDTVVMLPGWNVSRGARLERDVALACGMRVVDFGENKIIYGLYNSLKEALEKLL
nr:MAG TPA: N-deoxyribosyltransferase [Caudoviricetes sp.]